MLLINEIVVEIWETPKNSQKLAEIYWNPEILCNVMDFVGFPGFRSPEIHMLLAFIIDPLVAKSR